MNHFNNHKSYHDMSDCVPHGNPKRESAPIQNKPMKTTLLVTKLLRNDKTYIATALYQEKKLLEVHLERLNSENILGNIYIGRVKNIVKNLNAAFIEIAPGVPCYYSLENCSQPLYSKKINSPRMVQGDEVVVQVIRENSGNKPAKVSTNLNFTGKYLVLTSENTSIGISKKLDAKVRQRLQKTLSFDKICDFGIIVRTNAAYASEEEIQEEYQLLKQEYLHLKETFLHRTAFCCLKKQMPEYLSSIQNLNQEQFDTILTDDLELFEHIQQYLKQFQPRDIEKLTLYQDDLLSLNKLYSLDTRLQEALQERVWLKSGGYLVIQPTEALTVIDVNSGKSIAKKQAQEHYLKINLEAAAEIAHQLRLRNLSGIVIIDFIDMKSRVDNDTLMKTLRNCVCKDPVPVQVVDMTRLHLVELTRKKVRKPLKEQFL